MLISLKTFQAHRDIILPAKIINSFKFMLLPLFDSVFNNIIVKNGEYALAHNINSYAAELLFGVLIVFRFLRVEL